MQSGQITQLIRQVVQVSYQYQVYFTRSLFSLRNPLFKDIICQENSFFPKNILYAVDKGVARRNPKLLASIASYSRHHSEYINLVCPPLVMRGGEDVKNNPKYVKALHEAIDTFGICRHSYIIAIGGGAFLDVVGFASAIAHRGIRLIRIPTTVLSQNDSGVGVKNGINAYGKKNFLGTFVPPWAVINDTMFLKTLSDRDWRSGIAEAVKVALLKDLTFFDFIETHAHKLIKRDMDLMEQLIHRCAELHLNHIATSGDPFEFGSSRPLDFGHWAAHKIEALSNFRLRHGEAVAIGIALDTTYAFLSGLLAKHDWERILKLLRALQLPTYTTKLSSCYSHNSTQLCSILHGLKEFREHLGGRLTIPLLKGIGQSIEVHEIDESVITTSIQILKRDA